MMEPWFLLFDGDSVDGRGDPKYHARTLDPSEARKLLKDNHGIGYWTGHVKIVTDKKIHLVRHPKDFDRVMEAIASDVNQSKVAQYIEKIQQLSKSYGLDVVAFVDPQATELQAALGIYTLHENILSDFDDALSIANVEHMEQEYLNWTAGGGHAGI